MTAGCAPLRTATKATKVSAHAKIIRVFCTGESFIIKNFSFANRLWRACYFR